MKQEQRTAGPWKVDGFAGNTQVRSAEDGSFVADCSTSLRRRKEDGTDVNNAYRIVSCVNALEGLNPEAVRGLIEALQFYAEPNNYSRDDWDVMSVLTAEYGEPGKRARSALDAVKGETK